MGLFGFGTSENATTTNVHNENVAAQSGIATGNNSENVIQITTADPDVARSALSSNIAVSQGAFGVADHALDTNAAVSMGAINAVNSNAALSIYSSNDLATKFAQSTSAEEANQIALLTSVNQQNADASLANNKLASSALDQSFAIAHNAAPQTDAAQVENATDSVSKILYTFFGLGALIAIVYFFSKKN